MWKTYFFQGLNSWRLNLSRICPVFRVVQMQDLIFQSHHLCTGKYDWKQKFTFLHLWLDHLLMHFKHLALKYLVKMPSWTKYPHPLQKQRWDGHLKVSEANPNLSLHAIDGQDPPFMDFKNYLTLSSTGNYIGAGEASEPSTACPNISLLWSLNKSDTSLASCLDETLLQFTVSSGQATSDFASFFCSIISSNFIKHQ